MSNPTISVINPDGTPGGSSLTAQEQALLDQALRQLQADPEFQRQVPGATLSRVESNRGVADTAHGRLYLRFEMPGQAATEFWAHQGKKASVAFKSGSVTVAQQPS